MDRLSRPKTVNQASFQFGTDLAARNTLGEDSKITLPPIGLGSRVSVDWETGSRLGHRRQAGPPGLLARSVEVQTEPPSHPFGEYQDMYETVGGGYRPDEAFTDRAEPAPYQLPGYHSLPVMQPQRMMNPYGRAVISGRVHTAAGSTPGQPLYRSGRNGSNWRHVTQCTGNLGNHIVFINGHVKAEDVLQFPPHGYPAGAGPAVLSQQHLPVSSAFPPARQAAGNRSSGQYNSKALQRARTGNKYWFEDKRPPTSNWKYALGSRGSSLGVAGTPLAGGF